MTGPLIRGALVDDQTRCAHYAGPLDVVAIRFACCGDWYPCLHCHEESADHGIRAWSMAARDEQAILCGVCSGTLSITAYLEADSCPWCAADFNPGCALHHSVYFEL